MGNDHTINLNFQNVYFLIYFNIKKTTIMKPLNKLLLLAVFIFQMLHGNAQTINPPVYSTDWIIKDLTSKGDTLFVGGWFDHVGKYSQGMALFTTTSDQPNPNLAQLGQNVISTTSDGNGGYYVLTYNNEIIHILPNLSLDPNFSIPVSGPFVYDHKILYHNGIIYMGGNQLYLSYGAGVGDLMAFDATTQQMITNIPYVNGIVRNIRLFGNHLYIMGDFDSVGNLPREKVAQVDLSNHTVTGWRLQPGSGYDITETAPYWFHCNDIVEYGSNVIVGGSFQHIVNNTGTTYHALLTDTLTGTVSKSWIPQCGLFGCADTTMYWAADIEVMAINGNTLYTYSAGTFDTRITAFNIAGGLSFLWSRYFNMTALADELVATPNAVFIGGERFGDIYLLNTPNDSAQHIEAKIKNAIKLNAATGAIENWHLDPEALTWNEVFTMVLSGNNLFLGGRFSHVNSLDRKGLYAIKSSTGQVLPYHLNMEHYHDVNAMKIAGDTLYLAGHFDNDIYDSIESTVIAIDLNTGQQIIPNTPYVGTAYKMEISNDYIFLAGTINDTSGGINKSNLLAINRHTGLVENWAPNPDWDVTALHIADNRLYVGGNFTTISGQSRNGVATYDLNTLSLLNWQSSIGGNVRAIKSDDSLIYLGGSIQILGGSTMIDNFVSVKKTDGSIVKYAPYMNNPVDIQDILLKNKTLIAGGFSYDSCGNPAIYKGDTILSKVNDICINVQEENGSIYAMELIGNDLYYAGSFLRTNDSLMGSNIGRITFPTGYFNDTVTNTQAVNLQKLKVFPNPTSGSLYIQTDDDIINEVVSIDGRTVVSKNNKKVMDLSFLPAGMYILHCYNKEGIKIQSEKIIKQ